MGETSTLCELCSALFIDRDRVDQLASPQGLLYPRIHEDMVSCAQDGCRLCQTLCWTPATGLLTPPYYHQSMNKRDCKGLLLQFRFKVGRANKTFYADDVSCRDFDRLQVEYREVDDAESLPDHDQRFYKLGSCHVSAAYGEMNHRLR